MIDKYGRQVELQDGVYVVFNEGVEVIRAENIDIIEAHAPEVKPNIPENIPNPSASEFLFPPHIADIL